MTTCTPHLHQLHFQGFNDNNSAADADDCTSLAAVDNVFFRNVDTIFGLRFEIEETANCSSMNNQFHIQHNINGAGYITTTTGTSGVRLANGVPNDTLATTNRISGSALGFVAGEYDEEGTTANVTLQNQHSEMHFVLTLVGAELNDADSIDFRIIAGAGTLTEYHATPTVTAVKAAGSTVSREVQDTFSFSDAVSRDLELTRSIADTFSFIDSLARDQWLTRSPQDAFTFTENLDAEIPGAGPQTHDRELQDEFTFVDSLSRDQVVERLLQETFAFTEELQRQGWFTRGPQDVFAFVENLTRTVPGEPEASADELSRQALKWLIRNRKWRAWMGTDLEELTKYGIGRGKIREPH